MTTTDDSRPPFVAVTDYDRRVLRGLELARTHALKQAFARIEREYDEGQR